MIYLITKCFLLHMRWISVNEFYEWLLIIRKRFSVPAGTWNVAFVNFCSGMHQNLQILFEIWAHTGFVTAQLKKKKERKERELFPICKHFIWSRICILRIAFQPSETLSGGSWRKNGRDYLCDWSGMACLAAHASQTHWAYRRGSCRAGGSRNREAASLSGQALIPVLKSPIIAQVLNVKVS